MSPKEKAHQLAVDARETLGRVTADMRKPGAKTADDWYRVLDQAHRVRQLTDQLYELALEEGRK